MNLNICVFSSSRGESNPDFSSGAGELGLALAQEGFPAMYGGTSIGLMGIFAEAVRSGNGRLTGIILERFKSEGIMDPDLDETIIVDSLGERKAIMFERSRAFIALPGGFGTMDEIAEMLVINALNRSCEKPVILFNINGFYDPFFAYCKLIYTSKLASREEYGGPVMCSTVRDVMAVLNTLRLRDGR